MVKGNRGNVCKGAAVILVGMLLLLSVLVGSGPWNTSADAEDIPGGGISKQLINEQDGSKIESIHIKWVTPDTINDGDPNHLYLSTTSDATLQMQWQIDVSFSGQHDYQPGDIRITIPRRIWHPRNEARKDPDDPLLAKGYVGGMTLSVPDASVTTSDFHYDIVGNNYVITNTKVMGATSKAMFQFTINGIVPHEMLDRGESDSFSALVEVTTNQGNVIAMESDQLQAQLDTQEEIESAFKTGEFYQDVPDKRILPRWMLDNLPEDNQNPDDYVYVRWYTYPYYTGNQNFTLELSDQVGDAWEVKNDGSLEFVEHGIMLGCSDAVAKDGKVSTVTENDGTVRAALYTETILENTYNSYGDTKYNNGRYIWTAYKKDPFKKDITYHFDNTCEWTLTEQDPDYPWGDDTVTKVTDEQKVTTAVASTSVRTTIANWEYPPGRFMVFKYVDTTRDHTHPTVLSSQVQNAEHKKTATYEMALNQLREGKDVDMLYEVLSVGYGYIFTAGPLGGEVGWEDIHGNHHTESIGEGYDPNWDSNAWADDPNHYLNWYYTMDTADRWDYFDQVNASAGDPQLTTAVSDDYEFRELFIAEPELFNYGKQDEFNQDYMFSEESLYGFLPDDTLAKPKVSVYVEVDNSASIDAGTKADNGDDGWLLLGTFEIPEGGLQLDFGDYTDVTGGKPVTGYRTRVETNQAAIKLATYPIIRLKASERVQGIVETLFSMSETPSTTFRNDDQMYVELYTHAADEANTAPEQRMFLDPEVYYRQYIWQDDARAELTGAGYGVEPYKTVSYWNDTANKRVVLHYAARVIEESNLTDMENYDLAVERGAIDRETSGIWYDLLPEGVQPMMETVRLREGDTVVQKYTIDNYKNSGRVLLVVEAELSPQPEPTYNGKRVADTLTLSFDAYYPWDQIDITGSHLVNYVAFESGNDKQLGTLLGRIGEPDAMKRQNNVYTPNNEPAIIVNAMTDLDPTTEENRFVYAKADVNLQVNRMAVSDYNKAVKSDLDGVWTQGLDNQVQVNVYEGQYYTYRLRVHSSKDTITKDLVLYDSIENYDLPHDGTVQHDTTKQKDYDKIAEQMKWYGTWQEKGKGQWRGRLLSVDMSEFLERDVAPVLYYAREENLQFGDTIGSTVDETIFFNKEGRYQLTDESTWHRVAPEDVTNGLWTVPEGMNISAIAIDARHRRDGSDFELEPDQAVAAYLHMVAPDDHEDSEHWGPAKSAYARKEGMETSTDVSAIDWEAAMNPLNNMHAFNNTRLICTQLSGAGDAASKTTMIRNDYTRVGIMPRVMKVTKEWQDDNNHDGLRPETIMVQLERKLTGEAGDEAYQPVDEPFELSDENDWTKVITQKDVVNEAGVPYLYRFVDTVDGYTAMSRDNGDGTFTLINRHEKETVRMSGEKQWTMPDGSKLPSSARKLIPEYIRVKLLQDGKVLETITVKPNATGAWHYNFEDLDKYVDHAAPDFDPAGSKEHEYTVKEEPVYPFISSTDGLDGLPDHIKEDFQLNEDLFKGEDGTIYNVYLPYGDLSVGKTVQHVNDTTRNTEFKFMLFLEGADGKPVSESYRYEIVDAATGAVVDASQSSMEVTGTIGHNNSFVLRGGQKLMVYNLPSGTKYKVFEEEEGAFTCTASSGAEGHIGSGDVTEAKFENSYHAEGTVQFKAEKTIKGTELKRGRFRFTITDMTEGSDTYGQVIRSTLNDQGQPGLDEDGSQVSVGEVLFGSINYTQDDLGEDGKATYIYEIAEYRPTEAPGYFTYDETKYTVTVNLTDRGDGTLDVQVVYPENQEKLSFSNEYHASGSTPLKTWKELKGRKMTDGEFEFALYRLEEDGTLTPVGEHAHNSEDGTISFPELTFTEADAGKSYIYVVQEVAGEDPTVYYNEGFVGIRITVTDQGDGTLSFERENLKVSWEHALCPVCGGSGHERAAEPSEGNGTNENGDATQNADASELPVCEACAGTGNVDKAPDNKLLVEKTDDPPVLVNGLAPGSLKLVKAVDDPHGNGELFTFHVTLTGEDLSGVLDDAADVPAPELSPNYNAPTAPDIRPSEYSAYSVIAPRNMTAVPIPVATPAPPEPFPDMPDEGTGDGTGSGTGGGSPLYHITDSELAKGEAYAVVDKTTGIMTIFRTQSLTDPDGNPVVFADDKNSVECGDLIYAKNLENNWYPGGFTSTVKEIRMEDGIKLNNSINLGGYSNCTQMDLSKLDVSGVASMSGMFAGCSSLESVNLTGWDTSNVHDMSGMFNGCSSLESIDLTGLNTSEVMGMSGMFGGCSSLKTIDMRGLDTSKVTSVGGMFSGCTSLQTVNMEGANFSSVGSTGGMFSGCTSLQTVNMKGANFSSVGSTGGMFIGCTSLQTVNMEGADFSGVGSTGGMFSSCSALQTVNLKGADFAGASSIGGMFSGCTGLKAVNLEGVDFSSVKSMNGMFSGCSSLERMDLSNVGITSVTDISYMFNGCSSLTDLRLDDWDVSNLTSMGYVFSGCVNLERLSMRNWDWSDSRLSGFSYNNFDGCVKLTNMDVSGWNMAGAQSVSGFLSNMIRRNVSGLVVNASNWSVPDLTSLQGVLSGSGQLRAIDMSGWTNSTELTNMGYAFAGCSSLEYINLDGLNTSQVTDMNSLFNSCVKLEAVNVKDFDVSNVTNLANMFSGCTSLTDLNLNNWKVGKVTNAFYSSGMLTGCGVQRLSMANWDWQGTTVTSLSGLLVGTSALTDLNISGWNITGLTRIESLFTDCGKYSNNTSYLDVDMRNWTAPDLTTFENVFSSNSTLRSVNMAGWSNLPALTTTRYMFNGTRNLKRLDLTGMDTSHVTDMSSMFNGCSSLQNPKISGLDTSSVTDMTNMFGYCSSLAVMDLSRWDVSKVTTMAHMFGECSNLQQVNMHGWDIASLTNLNSMFYKCSYLTDVNMSDWKVNSLVRNLGSMFCYCRNLKGVDFTNWQCGVSNLSSTFSGCSSLTSLNLSGLKGNGSISYNSTFYYCSNLEALDIRSLDVNASNDSYMLTGVTKLSTLTRGSNTYFSSSSGYASISAPEGWTNGKEIVAHGTLFTSPGYADTWVKYNPEEPEEGDRVTVDNRTQEKLEFTVRLYGHESITFPNLPAGTAYNIYEETPEGWALVEQSNVSGNIPASATATATFNNSYQPTSVSVQFQAIKLLDNQLAEKGAFSFELVDCRTGRVIDTVTNGSEGYIAFNPIVITQSDLGWHTEKIFEYEIREVFGTDETIRYDTHVESVQVYVTRSGDVMTATVTYADPEAGAVFKNTTIPGRLQLTKNAVGASEEVLATEPEFTYEVRFTNKFGEAVDPGTLSYSYTEAKVPAAPAEPEKQLELVGTSPKARLLMRTVETETPVVSETAPKASTPSKRDPSKIYHVPEDYDLENTVGYAVLSRDKKTLTFFRSYHSEYIKLASQYGDRSFKPASGSDTTPPYWIGMDGRQYTGYLLWGFEETGKPTWQDVGPYMVHLETITMDDPIKVKGDAVSMKGWFEDEWHLKEVNLRYLDTSNVVDMSDFFKYSKGEGLTTLDVSMLDTSNVTDMSYMFARTDGMNGGYGEGDDITFIDVSNFDTSKVTTMTFMFGGRNITTVDVGDWNMSNVTSLYGMFYYCMELETLDVSNWDVSKVEDFSYFTSTCRSLETIDVSRWDTSSATNMEVMFGECDNMQTVPVGNWDVSKVTNFERMFIGADVLETVDVSRWDTSSVTEFSNMFWNCPNLTELDVSGWNVANGTKFDDMFSYCRKLSSLDVSNWDTSSATTFYWMFNECNSLTELDVSGWDVSNVTIFDYMFHDCNSLTKLDVSHWNTSNAKELGDMFAGCTGITELDVSGFSMGQVNDVASMFGGCENLNYVNLSNFDSSSAEYDSNIFFNTPNLYRVTVNEGTCIPENYPACHEEDEDYTGYWVLEDGDGTGQRTSEELFATHDATKAGTWVWEVKNRAHRFTLDPNGGGVDVDMVKVNFEDTSALPEPVRPGYKFTGWNDKQDGSGKDYGNEYTNSTGKPMPVPTKLYAQWEIIPGGAAYMVEHFHQPITLSTNLDDYVLANTDTIAATAGTYVTPDYRDYRGFYPISEKTSVLVEMDLQGNPLGRAAYYYNRKTYTINFDANGGEGSMDSIQIVTGIAKQLPANAFTNGDYRFIGWNTEPDGSGVTYVDKQFVNVFDAETVTLYAQWFHTETVQSTDSGVFTVKLKPGQTITFLDVPFGTQYEVVEINLPEGWELTDQQGETGSIGAGQVSTAEFTNTYSTSGKVAPVIEKRMQAGVPEAGAYTFGLYLESDCEDGKLREGAAPIDTATNAALDERETIPDPNDVSDNPEVAMIPNPYWNRSMAFFHDLEYKNTPDGAMTDGYTTSVDGTFVYYIAELAGNDDNVIYDDTLCKVVVKVADTEGKGRLTTAVLYDGLADASFTNEYAKGSLRLSKTVKDATDVNAQKAFVFTVSFTDQQGGALSGEYPCSVTTADGDKSTTLTLENGQATVALKAGESILISELPQGTGYTVTEQKEDGFTAVSQNATGTIVKEQAAEVTYENTYQAIGSVQLHARKRLSPGMTLKAGEFGFDLRNANGDLLETATNDAEGNVSFSPLNYTVYDVGEHVYFLTEQDSAYSKQPMYDYSFDTAKWKVTVTVTDNGDGTLNATPVYEAGEDIETEAAEFFNSTQTMVRVRKVWKDAGHPEKRPTMITVRLYGDGKEVAYRVLSQVVNGVDADTWEVSFTGLPKYNAEGKEIKYTATEDELTDYVVEVGETQVDAAGNQNAVTITNYAKTSLRIEKKVVSSQTITRPFQFMVKLMDENGQLLTGSYAYEGAVEGVLENGTGKIRLRDGEAVEIKGLPLGTRFTVEEAWDPAFTVEKTVVAEPGTDNVIGMDAAIVTFKNVEVTIQISVTKRWVGEEGDSITLTLGMIIGDTFVPYDQAPEVEQIGNTYTFRNLPKYDADGQLITWAIQEETVPGYGLKNYVNVDENKGENRWALDGATIVNKQTTDVRVHKVWMNVNGAKPQITLTLYKDGLPTNKRPTKLGDGWYVFYNLEVNHTYYVVEEPLPGYETTYVNSGEHEQETNCAYNGGKIVNTKTDVDIPQTGDEAPLKTWMAVAAVSLLGILLLYRKRRED